MSYLSIRTDNQFSLLKTGSQDLIVTVYVQAMCETDEWTVIVPEQTVTDIVVITLPDNDGLYKIVIVDEDGTHEELVSNYTDFLTSMIEDIQYVLCGCPCEDCPDCNKKEKDYLSAFVKVLAYNMIKGGIYNQYLTDTNDCVKCNIFDTNQCILRTESMLGNADNTLLMKQIISYYYLVFFYVDLKLNGNLATIKSLYKYNEIIKCIKKINIDENCIKNIILTQTEGIYTIEYNPIFI